MEVGDGGRTREYLSEVITTCHRTNSDYQLVLSMPLMAARKGWKREGSFHGKPNSLTDSRKSIQRELRVYCFRLGFSSESPLYKSPIQRSENFKKNHLDEHETTIELMHTLMKGEKEQQQQGQQQRQQQRQQRQQQQLG
uniref:Uncharacterized protein n=1 Tax=Vespula pensylvanica TaxID=30213 RepID=A0A834NZQ5_VESPE|nr:hypothetical protein H0235_009889 [Vespula pensylvanica]